jgi:hypothetical protein
MTFRLWKAVLMFITVFPLHGCEADMNVNKGDQPTIKKLDTEECLLDTKMLTPLSSIDRLISGKSVDQDPCDKKNYFQFEERFYSNGKWEYFEVGAALMTYQGTWSIQGSSLLTENAELGRLSRNIYKNDEGKMFMESIIHRKTKEVVKVVPIRIVDINKSYGARP